VLRRELAAALRRYRPDFVLGFNYRDITVTGKWNTPDHRHTGRALLDAIGDAGNRWIFPDAGEPWAGIRQVAMANSPNRPTPWTSPARWNLQVTALRHDQKVRMP
jgi:LmbE family N-acetylglucosaminyl deacetylase